ncbi:hypothetical protein DFH09DRAFT_1077032 [Mycena vulgaris]|nr:hypothetical protein DFH09DRAFT_1077032 [Mycena vulgaris]
MDLEIGGRERLPRWSSQTSENKRDSSMTLEAAYKFNLDEYRSRNEGDLGDTASEGRRSGVREHDLKKRHGSRHANPRLREAVERPRGRRECAKSKHGDCGQTTSKGRERRHRSPSSKKETERGHNRVRGTARGHILKSTRGSMRTVSQAAWSPTNKVWEGYGQDPKGVQEEASNRATEGVFHAYGRQPEQDLGQQKVKYTGGRAALGARGNGRMLRCSGIGAARAPERERCERCTGKMRTVTGKMRMVTDERVSAVMGMMCVVHKIRRGPERCTDGNGRGAEVLTDMRKITGVNEIGTKKSGNGKHGRRSVSELQQAHSTRRGTDGRERCAMRQRAEAVHNARYANGRERR